MKANSFATVTTAVGSHRPGINHRVLGSFRMQLTLETTFAQLETVVVQKVKRMQEQLIVAGYEVTVHSIEINFGE